MPVRPVGAVETLIAHPEIPPSPRNSRLSSNHAQVLAESLAVSPRTSQDRCQILAQGHDGPYGQKGSNREVQLRLEPE
jgi:hypothetical protein